MTRTINKVRSWSAVSSIVAIVLIASGCATKLPMAMGKKTETLDTTKEGIVLMSVKLTNKIFPAQPHISYVLVGDKSTEETTVKDAVDHALVGHERNTLYFDVGRPYKSNPDKGNQYEEYLISMKLEPGKYFVRDIQIQSKMFPFRGRGKAPMNSPFELKANEIVYLGHVAIVRRTRKCHEFRAGGVFPLDAQAVLGYSSGTYDINIIDNYDRDISVFQQNYPVLKNYTVTKSLLAPWKRPVESDPASCSNAPADE